jgi:hypothetical protein
MSLNTKPRLVKVDRIRCAVLLCRFTATERLVKVIPWGWVERISIISKALSRD